MSERPYVFGDVPIDVETERLDLLEAIYDPYSHELLRRIGVPRGSRCLEVGAGAGSMVLALLSLCGRRGEVVATDVDMRWLDQIKHPNLSAVRHNIVTDDTDVLGTFDLIHVRLVLTHLGRTNGLAALRKLVGLLRPGGHIVVEDFCLFDTADPAHPDAARLVENMAGWYRFYSTFADPSFGLIVPRVLTEEGLVEVRNEMRTSVTGADDPYRVWLPVALESVRTILEANDVLPDGVDNLIAMTGQQDLYYVPILTTACWAQRPT